uniref:Protein KRI1 homolog n=1 Tax=Cacopsylla melanoneura TaxID=428564 RepID=A0A8D8XI63_9HEMI
MSEEELSETSSSSEEEDEYGKELTIDVEKKFLKTLQSLKTKDPTIYDANVKFFDLPKESAEEDQQDNPKEKKEKKKKVKPFLLSDYDRLLVKSGGEIKEECDVLPSYNEEQEELKSDLKKALLDSSDDEDSSLLTLKPKVKLEVKKELESSDEEVDLKQWLTGSKNELKNKEVEKDLKPLHDIWTNPELDEGETFLRDYILNKRYLDDTKADNSSDNSDNDDVSETNNSLEENDFDEKQEEFEHKFNFRFEEPDQEFIKRYPRTMENSMRRKETKRKLKREQAKKNKEDKLEKKKTEMKKMKKEKREEILKHLESLKTITGNQTLAFKEEMLDGDFNPDEHDKIMEAMFNEEFYAGEDDGGKPVFDDDDDEKFEYPDENTDDNQAKEGDYNEENDQFDEEDDQFNEGDDQFNEEGDQFNEEKDSIANNEQFNGDGELITDCDYDPSNAPTHAKGRKLSRSKLKRLKRKEKQSGGAAGATLGRAQKSLFAQAVSKPKPRFNPQDDTFMKYVDEYYGLEFEDLIGGDLPCRFKYKRVVPNSYGLTIDEILSADDKELNRWCSVQKIYSQRAEHVEKNEVKVYKQRAMNEALKRKLLPSLYKQPEERDDEDDNARILPTEDERKEMMQKKQKKIAHISEQFEKTKQESKENGMDEETDHEGKKRSKDEMNDDVIDETIVNEYLKEKKKSAAKVMMNRKRKLEILGEKETAGMSQKQEHDEGVVRKKMKLKSKSEKKKPKDGIPDGVSDKTNDRMKNAKKKNNVKDEAIAQIETKSKIEETKKDNESTQIKKKSKTVNESTQIRIKSKNEKTNTKKDNDCDSKGQEKGESESGAKKRRKRKKKIKKKQPVVAPEGEGDTIKTTKKVLKKKIKVKKDEMRRKQGDKKNKKEKVTEWSDDRLKAYGINPKKFKSKLIYGNKEKEKNH